MNRGMSLMGLGGTLLILAALGMAIIREPARQAEAAEAIGAAQVAEGIALYAEYCVTCHGASGEGLAAFPPLDSEGVRLMDEDTLFRTIERGRYNTAMAAYGVGEGGILTQMQITSLVTLIQADAWQMTAARVEALGRTPPVIAAAEVPAETLALISTLPGGDSLVSGLTLYAENCAACHGANGEGSALAPALNVDALRERLSDTDITRIISQGVSGTLMAAWNRALLPEQITDLTGLIRSWDMLEVAGITLPVIESAPVDMSPEAIATGQRLYGLVCAQCHGTNGFGTPLAPALNNQGFLSQTPDEAIQQIIARGVPGTAMPSWGGYLTEADIAAITAYLRSLEPTAPAIAAPR